VRREMNHIDVELRNAIAMEYRSSDRGNILRSIEQDRMEDVYSTETPLGRFKAKEDARC
jgi:hypothetical protein